MYWTSGYLTNNFTAEWLLFHYSWWRLKRYDSLNRSLPHMTCSM